MAVLCVDFRYTSRVERSIKDAVSSIDTRKDDYDSIIKNVNNVPSSTGNLYDCNVYLKKKSNELQKKMDKLNSFKTKLTTFASNAKAADERVATHVADETKTFYKAVGIKTGWAAGWDNVKKTCKDVWSTVVNFYKKNKFVIDFIVDLAFFAVAVVSLIAAIPTGGATLVFSVFAITQSLGDLVGSSVALGYHIAGNDEKAGIWAERGLKDGMQWVGGKIGGELGANIAGVVCDAMSLASIVYSAGKLGKNLFKSIDFRNTNNMSAWKRISNAGKNIFGYSTTGTSLKDLKACMEVQAILRLTSVDAARNVMIGCDFVKNIKTTINIVDSIYDDTFFVSGNKIGSTISKAIETIKNCYSGVGAVTKYAVVD